MREAVWLKRFLKHLGIVKDATDPVTVRCDNQAAIAYCKDPKYHCKTKHIDTKHKYIRDTVAKKKVHIEYIASKDMIADPFTKPIPRDAFMSHVKGFGMHKM